MRTRSLAPAALVSALALVVTTACTAPGPSGGDPGDTTSVVSPSPSGSPTAAPDDVATEAADADDAAPEEEPADEHGETPEESFRAWLAASRVPDVEVACGYLAPELVERMVAEMTSQGWPGITDCASMTTTTAGLYAAVGDVPDVEITVREERADATVLSVVYAGGDCGSAVMAPAGARWVVTEQSEEEC